MSDQVTDVAAQQRALRALATAVDALREAGLHDHALRAEKLFNSVPGAYAEGDR